MVRVYWWMGVWRSVYSKDAFVYDNRGLQHTLSVHVRYTVTKPYSTATDTRGD
jgi:hypothetical protein